MGHSLLHHLDLVGIKNKLKFIKTILKCMLNRSTNNCAKIQQCATRPSDGTVVEGTIYQTGWILLKSLLVEYSIMSIRGLRLKLKEWLFSNHGLGYLWF